MAGVVNDIEALAEFRAHLMRFNHDLAENSSTIQAHWRELGEFWRDDMYRLFGEALEEVTPGIATYLSATEGHEAHLAALIERLSGYLETGAGAGLGVGRPPEVRRGGRRDGQGTGGVTGIHADIDALKGLHGALVTYRHAQRDVIARGEDQLTVTRASLEAKACRCGAQLELGQAEYAACQDRAAQADPDTTAAGGLLGLRARRGADPGTARADPPLAAAHRCRSQRVPGHRRPVRRPAGERPAPDGGAPGGHHRQPGGGPPRPASRRPDRRDTTMISPTGPGRRPAAAAARRRLGQGRGALAGRSGPPVRRRAAAAPAP